MVVRQLDQIWGPLGVANHPKWSS